jgi:hypothetical protein
LWLTPCSPGLAAGLLLLLLLLSLLLPEASSQGLDVTLAQLAADAQATAEQFAFFEGWLASPNVVVSRCSSCTCAALELL